MKQWLARFRISCALDEAPRCASSARERRPAAKALEDFASRLRVVDENLGSPPVCPPPDRLHLAIMAAVRAEARKTRRKPAQIIDVWFARAAFAVACLAMVAALVVLWNQSSREHPGTAVLVSSAAEAIELGHRAAQGQPSVLIAPMTEELENLNRDFERTAALLLANIP